MPKIYLKKVIVTSPEFSEIAEYIKLRAPRYLDNFTALPLDEKVFSDNKPNYLGSSLFYGD
jgi:hypothetical protein